MTKPPESESEPDWLSLQPEKKVDLSEPAKVAQPAPKKQQFQIPPDLSKKLKETPGRVQSWWVHLHPRYKHIFWQNKPKPAFWTTIKLLSFVVNIVLIVVVLALARELFVLKSIIGQPLIGGLYNNFQKMDDAHIRTTIPISRTLAVNDSINVAFNLPVDTDTTVVLNNDTPIGSTMVYLNGVGVPTNITLPKGTALNIHLNITVPVSQKVPVSLNVPVQMDVPVDIPLKNTELHEPFTGLQKVVAPYDNMLNAAPASWENVSACKPFSWFCSWFFK